MKTRENCRRLPARRDSEVELAFRARTTALGTGLTAVERVAKGQRPAAAKRNCHWRRPFTRQGYSFVKSTCTMLRRYGLRCLQVGLAAAGCLGGALIVHAGPFPAELELSNLLPENGGDGTLGFVINGIEARNLLGDPVSCAGDVNGDGIDDLIIGAHGAAPDGNITTGQSYVVYGTDQGFPAIVDLASLDGNNGFALNGIDGSDQAGWHLGAAGDVNADGIADLIIGARGADPHGLREAGESYVIFGNHQGLPAEIELSSLLPENGGDGTKGFVLYGIDSSDSSGTSPAGAGDVNGDGIDDLIIGANNADPNGRIDAGESYVVFGTAQGFPAVFELSDLLPVHGGDGGDGFVLNGIAAGDLSGISVAGAGDVNADGIGDLVIGALGAAPNEQADAGQSYVVFGTTEGFPAVFQLAGLLPDNGGDGTRGFVLNGVDNGDWFGGSVSGAGDVNHDGIDDLIFGAQYASPNGKSSAGQGYVVFGTTAGFPAIIELAAPTGTYGFALNGTDSGDWLGSSVSDAGDVNGDDIDDLILGAPHAYKDDEWFVGENYVVFGSEQGFPWALELSSLIGENGGDGSRGFVLKGINRSDNAGGSVSGAGDVNADGIDDLIIGADNGDPEGEDRAGQVYVVFGRASATLRAAVQGIDPDIASCTNLSDPQAVFLTFPRPRLTAKWDCAQMQLDFSAGERVKLSVRGSVALPLLRGSSIGLEFGAIARCINATRGVAVQSVVTAEGAWDCVAAGLPVQAGDLVTTLVTGVVR